jgi:C4-dicarboxylate transporter, DctM subunit
MSGANARPTRSASAIVGSLKKGRSDQGMSTSTSGKGESQRFLLPGLAWLENWVISVALLAMTLLPILEIVLRRLFGFGIKGSIGIVEHLCLIVGMVGGVVSARHNRLLTLSTIGHSLKGRWNTLARSFASGTAAATAALLSIGSATFVKSERQAETILAYGMPLWVIELAMPLGFALIALYVLLHSGDKPLRSVTATAIAAALVLTAAYLPPDQHHLVAALVVLLGATILGVPVFVTLGGLALILFWDLGVSISTIAARHYDLVTDDSLPTIPLFTLAGYILAESSAPRRLTRVFRALFGQLAGSSVIVTVLLCAFFTTFTGASGVTILAIGGLLMPVLLSEGYEEKKALGLVTSAGSLGLLFPPCLPLILYAIVAKIPLEKMFLGGMVPGALMVVATGWWGLRHCPSGPDATSRFNSREALAAVADAKWELLVPVIAIASLFSGVATPVESAALTALYALVIEVFIYRDLHPWKDLPRVMAECGLLVGGILLILGVALAFTNYLVTVDFTVRAVDWIAGTIQSPWIFLLVLNLWLLVVGCLMDIYSAIVIQVPLLAPLSQRFNIDPIHLGIIFLANLEVGYLTPPVGLNLFISSFRFNRPLPEVTRAALPIAAVLLAAVLLITYVPALTTTLPYHLGP